MTCKWCGDQFHSYRCDLLDFREADRVAVREIERINKEGNMEKHITIDYEEQTRPIKRVSMFARGQPVS